MKSADYWRERFSALEESASKQASDYIPELEKMYQDAVYSVQKEIESWYARFAINNEISLLEARKMLTVGQLEEFKWNVEKYIDVAQSKNLSPEWIKKLENASARFHVSRLEAIQLNIQQQIELLYGNQTDGIDELLKGIVSNGYTQSLYEVSKGVGFGWDFAALNQNRLNFLLSRPWTTDNRTFRDRCWTNKAELVSTVNKELTQGFLRGDTLQEISAKIKKRFGVSAYKAQRLVHTETTYFNAASSFESYKEFGVKQIEVVETLDSRTCEICQPMDGIVIPLSQYEPGVTVPPYHPNCRGTTCPHFDDTDGERAARDAEGNVYYVPENMKYPEWKGTFVGGGSKSGLTKFKQS